MFCCMRTKPSALNEGREPDTEPTGADIDQEDGAEVIPHTDDLQDQDDLDIHQDLGDLSDLDSDLLYFTSDLDLDSVSAYTNSTVLTKEEFKALSESRKRALIGKIQAVGVVGKAQLLDHSLRTQSTAIAPSMEVSETGKSLPSVRFSEDVHIFDDRISPSGPTRPTRPTRPNRPHTALSRKPARPGSGRLRSRSAEVRAPTRNARTHFADDTKLSDRTFPHVKKRNGQTFLPEIERTRWASPRRPSSRVYPRPVTGRAHSAPLGFSRHKTARPPSVLSFKSLPSGTVYHLTSTLISLSSEQLAK